jgi:hypothetical protein
VDDFLWCDDARVLDDDSRLRDLPAALTAHAITSLSYFSTGTTCWSFA